MCVDLTKALQLLNSFSAVVIVLWPHGCLLLSFFWFFWVISLQKDGEEAVVVGNRDTLTLISSLLQVSIKGCEG